MESVHYRALDIMPHDSSNNSHDEGGTEAQAYRDSKPHGFGKKQHDKAYS